MKEKLLFLALAVVLAGCLGQVQPGSLHLADFTSLSKAVIEKKLPIVNFANITPSKGFDKAISTQNLYWGLNESSRSSVTVWMFEYPNENDAKAVAGSAVQRLKTEPGFPSYATVFSIKEAAGIPVQTISILGGRIDIYLFNVDNMVFWVQQNESNQQYVQELSLELIKLALRAPKPA